MIKFSSHKPMRTIDSSSLLCNVPENTCNQYVQTKPDDKQGKDTFIRVLSGEYLSLKKLWVDVQVILFTF